MMSSIEFHLVTLEVLIIIMMVTGDVAFIV